MAFVLAAVGRAAAQEVLSGPLEEGAAELPSHLGASDRASGPLLGDAGESGGRIVPVPMEETIEGSAFGAYFNDPMHAQSVCPPLFESSGSWLRRGFWYAEGDYMLMGREWDRKGLIFAFEAPISPATGDPTAGLAPGTTRFNFDTPGFGPALVMNPLIIAGSQPAVNGMARVTLGRFLFRDGQNRDHNVQATYYGAGNWEQRSQVAASPNSQTGLLVNEIIDRSVNPSFDGAAAMSLYYQSELNSFETNYLVKSRLGKDQMVLQPDGNWVRAAQPTQTYSFLAGVRYLRLTDFLNINSFDTFSPPLPDPTISADQFYNVSTTNNLLGGQLGVSIAHETARWSIGANVKGGSAWNRMDLRSSFNVDGAPRPDGVTNSTQNALAFIGECELLAKWHLRPNVSLRAGFELLYVNKLALGPHQLNFIRGGYPPIADDDDIVCMGTALGIEAYR